MRQRTKPLIAFGLASVLLLLSLSHSSGEREVRRFPEVLLEARSAYVYDLRAGAALFAKNENVALALASLTKLISALVAVEQAPGLKGDLGQTLLTSSNQGIRQAVLAVAPAEDFVRMMNRKVKILNLKSMRFSNETGLDIDEREAGGYGSAADINNLFVYMLKNYPDLLKDTAEASKRNTNLVASEIPGLLGSKTGLTDLAGGNLVFAFDPELGRPIVITILGSTEEGRFQDVRKLISATLEYINQ